MYVTAHSRILGQPGYMTGYSLTEGGLPREEVFQVKTPNSGGKSLNVAAAPFSETLVALTESEKGSVSVWKFNGTRMGMVASVDIVDAIGGRVNWGCCSDVVWLD